MKDFSNQTEESYNASAINAMYCSVPLEQGCGFFGFCFLFFSFFFFFKLCFQGVFCGVMADTDNIFSNTICSFFFSYTSLGENV